MKVYKLILFVVSMGKTIEEQVEEILLLKEGFDGEGSKSYSRETIERAKEHIQKMKRFMLERGVSISEPSFLPVSNGSIDLHWKNDNYEILLNVPEKGKAEYYAECKTGKFEGEM